MDFMISILKGLSVAVYCLVTAYVICLGKSKSGIKIDYLFTSLFILLILFMVNK